MHLSRSPLPSTRVRSCHLRILSSPLVRHNSQCKHAKSRIGTVEFPTAGSHSNPRVTGRTSSLRASDDRGLDLAGSEEPLHDLAPRRGVKVRGAEQRSTTMHDRRPERCCLRPCAVTGCHCPPGRREGGAAQTENGFGPDLAPTCRSWLPSTPLGKAAPVQPPRGYRPSTWAGICAPRPIPNPVVGLPPNGGQVSRETGGVQ